MKASGFQTVRVSDVIKKMPRGLSMMELLVVLILVSLVSVLLLEAMSFVFGRYARVQSYLAASSESQLPDRWYRGSIANLVATSDPEAAFTGASDAFEGMTLSPVTSTDGTLTRVRWYLEQDGAYINLQLLQNASEPMLVRRWRARSGEFSYINEIGTAQGEWLLEDGESPVLPAAIRLTIETDGPQPFEILAAVSVKRRATADYRDLL